MEAEGYRVVVWATDGSAEADAALEAAVRLVEPVEGRIVAVHCDQRLFGRPGSGPLFADEDDRRLRVRLQLDALRANGIEVEFLIRHSHREAADTVAAVAAEVGADVIACGTRGLGSLPGSVLGSFAQRLLRVSPCPVLVVPAGAAAGTRAATVELERLGAGR